MGAAGKEAAGVKLRRYRNLEALNFKGRQNAFGDCFLEIHVPGEVAVSRFVMAAGAKKAARALAVRWTLEEALSVNPGLGSQAPALLGRLELDAAVLAESIPLDEDWDLTGRELADRLCQLTGDSFTGYEETKYF